MSERKRFPAGFGVWLFAGLMGVLMMAVCLAGMAFLMVSRELSGSSAALLATAAAGAGSFFSGWLAAFRNREGGLLCGAVQGLIFAALLAILTLPAGFPMERSILTRFAAAVLCGILGGFLGVRVPAKKHIH